MNAKTLSSNVTARNQTTIDVTNPTNVLLGVVPAIGSVQTLPIADVGMTGTVMENKCVYSALVHQPRSFPIENPC